MPLPITLLYGGLTILFVTLLGANVTRLRILRRVGVDQPIPDDLRRPVRAHGNASEWVPLGLLLLLILEASGLGSVPLHLLGGLFLLGRVLHAAGTYTRSPWSVVGAGLNYALLFAMSFWAIALHFAR
ncbi:MAG TPA: MAPEG family protein [Anaeromyxobacteraceae bacterium]|nr:MAPEG family protein [Anaeromyxobacteraceae bacterium]